MKAKVLVTFYDKIKKVIRNVGDEFEVSKNRFTEINKTAKKLGYGPFIDEAVEESTADE